MSLVVTFILAVLVGAILGVMILFPILPEFFAKASWLLARRARRKVGRGIMFAFTGHHVCEYPGCVTLADHSIHNYNTDGKGSYVHLCCKHNDKFIAQVTGGAVPGRVHA